MLKDDIISLLRKNPNGLMAKHIASLLKKRQSTVSKILQGDMETFTVNNYVWTLDIKETNGKI